MITITADDIGAVISIDRAVKTLIDNKIINSISIFVNGNTNLNWVKDYIGKVKVGLHMTFSFGKPISSVSDPHLIDLNGFFKMPIKPVIATDKAIKKCISDYLIDFSKGDKNQLALESLSQFNKFKTKFGVNPDFISVHHDLDNCFCLNQVLKTYFPNYPSRAIKKSDSSYNYSYIFTFLRSCQTTNETIDIIETMIKKALTENDLDASSDIEVVFHPGFYSKELSIFSSYSDMRQREFEILSSKRILELLN